MDILMLSNGKIAGNEHVMGFASEAIVEQVKRTGAKNWVLIPYAVIRSSMMIGWQWYSRRLMLWDLTAM